MLFEEEKRIKSRRGNTSCSMTNVEKMHKQRFPVKNAALGCVAFVSVAQLMFFFSLSSFLFFYVSFLLVQATADVTGGRLGGLKKTLQSCMILLQLVSFNIYMYKKTNL